MQFCPAGGRITAYREVSTGGAGQGSAALQTNFSIGDDRLEIRRLIRSTDELNTYHLIRGFRRGWMLFLSRVKSPIETGRPSPRLG